ncbi:MAG: flavin reductase family protein [Halobacteriales archaeon]|nr:flavin reductase family protein [Halobacteriales archaeon]
MELDPTGYDSDTLHRVMTSIVAPRPIGWISTVDESGTDNLAPYSYFNAVSTNPPVVMFSAGDRDGEPKDTPRNALATGEFVVNLVTEPLASAMNETSAATDVSEFDFAEVDRADARTVAPPRVADAVAVLECTVYDSLRIYGNTVVFGDVTHISADEAILTDGKVDMEKIDAVGRLGGPYYTRLDRLDLERSHFGEWDGPTPPGFEIDDATNELIVDRESFLPVRDALLAVTDGQSIEAAAETFDLDPTTIESALDYRAWYLDGEVGDERIEAALAEADLPVEFTY